MATKKAAKKPALVKMAMRIDRETIHRLNLIAANGYVSRNSLVRQALAQFIEEQKK